MKRETPAPHTGKYMFVQCDPWLPEGPPSRVLLLLGWLNGGGAERVAVQLANDLNGGALDVRMGLLRRAGRYIDLVEPGRVHFRSWCERWFPADGASATFYRPDRFLRSVTVGPLAFRSIIREADPELVVSFCKGPNVLTYLALRGMRGKRPRWIAREGNNIVRSAREDGRDKARRGLEHALVRSTYRAADCVVVNSQQLAASLGEHFGLPAEKLRVIRNPVDVEAIRRRAAEPLDAALRGPLIVTTGRLVAQKGHDIVLRAFAASRFRASHQLAIVGEGPERAALGALAAGLGVADRVHFLGFRSNPWALMARAELFVLASRWEGFPNALLEALACGAPVLASDCWFGPGEMIEHGRNGWLVPPDDAEAMREALDMLHAAPELRRRLGAAATRRANEFRREVILPQFQALFQEHAGLSRLALHPSAGGSLQHSNRGAWRAGLTFS